MSYSGFTNWETWNTMLIIENDRKLYFKARELLKNNVDYSKFRKAMLSAKRKTRKQFRENLFSGRFHEKEDKKWHKVDWQQIYKHSIEYIKE